jgi:serine/threonine-protein kinase
MSISTSLPGARIGKYRIVAHIATGGMGTVYKAIDEDLGRTVALKVLHPDCMRNPLLVERFKREARHAARLSHKNIVTLFEYGLHRGATEVDDRHYLALEYIEGIDLSTYIRRKGRLDPEEARRIILQACKALEHAFAQGVTHRDIKPSNFLLADEEGRCRVKLTDLGLARMINEEEFRVTRAGTTVGTVDYLSPEQARDSSLADIRSDIYSLGCTFYHMLAGQPPFSEGGLGERVYKHIAADPVDVRVWNEDVPAPLWAVLRRMLAKSPDDRFQTPTELLEALRSVRGTNASGAESGGDQDSDSEVSNDFTDSTVADVTRAMPAAPTPPPAATREQGPPGASRPPKKRRTTVSDLGTKADVSVDALVVTPEQRAAAFAQYARATEVIDAGSDSTYALQLLLSCCKLDPVHLLYRKMLREVAREVSGGKRGWFGSLTNLPARNRLRAARNAGDHRKVLEDGEELLLRLPDDAGIQIDMAQSAEDLGLAALAVWLLEEARRQSPTDTTILRALAHLHERQKRFTRAIAVWEQIKEVNPSDPEASTRIKDLAASDTIARGNFRVQE